MPKNTVTQEQIDSLIECATIGDVKMGEKTTVVHVILANGFSFVESSSCVDPANYDHELGKELCLQKIKDKLWELEGYKLQDRLSGANAYDSVERIARVCHEANRAYCEAMQDYSQIEWDMAPEWQRKSVINGVIFHLHNPDASPAESHESWLKEKQYGGWQYGPVKDVEKKEHPCMLPYEQLPIEQRVKDYIFTAIVRAMQPA